MSVTEEERAYHTRKMRTRFLRMDINGDGYVTVEDYEELEKRFIEYGNLTAEQEQSMKDHIKDTLRLHSLEKGVKLTLEIFLKNMAHLPKCSAYNDTIRDSMSLAFDMVDTNGDGVISPEEFRVYFKCMGVPDKYAQESFKAIDTDHNGEISREEFATAGIEFFTGVEPGTPGEVFFGPIID